MYKKQISTSSIQKLGHPIKEIRERALLSIISKVKCGFIFDEKLDGLKKLLIYLLKWFEYDDTDFQEEALEALLFILKSSSGYALIKLIGPSNMISNLLNIKNRIDSKYYEPLQEIIQFVQTYENGSFKEYLSVPSLNMPSSRRSGNFQSHGDVTNVIDNSKHNLKSNSKTLNELECNENLNLSLQGVILYLMPWIHLCESDVRKILLNEECICSSESFEKATYFFINILLKDFPADVFLNRPTTIKAFQKMINRPIFSILAIEALSVFCDKIIIRIHQLRDPSLKQNKLPMNYYKSENFENYKQHDVKFSNDIDIKFCDPTIALNQLPLPLFCLDTMYIIVNYLSQTISEFAVEQKELYIVMNEINMIVTLNKKLLQILFDSIENTLWKTEKDNRFTQEIIQKQTQLLRSCGDLLEKLRISYSVNESKDSFQRVLYIHMLLFCTSFARWSDYSPLIPQTFISSLYNCIDDIAFALIYQKTHNDLLHYLEFQRHDNMDDQNKLKLYIEVKKIAESMNSAIKIIQNLDNDKNSPEIINIIKSSLLCLEFHKNINIITFIVNVFCLQIPEWNLSVQQLNDVKLITLMLLAHNSEWVKNSFYAHLNKIIKNILGGLIKTNSDTFSYNELSLKFLFDPTIMIEICSFGLESKSEQCRNHAQAIIQYLLKGKLLMSDVIWRLFLESILPAYPILNMHAAHDNDFGKSIIKTLNLKIGECMLIPKIDLVKGNIRLLYSKCFMAQMEGANNLLEFLQLDEENNMMLPNSEFIRPDILCSALRSVKTKNFNVNKPQDPNFYEEGALLQIINLLKSDLKSSKNDKIDGSIQVDPSFCRSALSQLAVILQQINLHRIFVENDGFDVVKYYLRASLMSSEFTTFPESAMSCISILNSILYTNSEVRQCVAEDINVLFNIVRGIIRVLIFIKNILAILLFPNDDNFIIAASQTLSLLSFSNTIVNSHESNYSNDHWTNNLCVHSSIAKRSNLPFIYTTHSITSSCSLESKENFIMTKQSASSYLRIYWSIVYFGGLNKVLSWPYVPETSYEDEFNPHLMITNADLSVLKETNPFQGCVSALYQIQNATSHKLVISGIEKLSGYITLSLDGKIDSPHFDSLPWNSTLCRFITAPPASPKDLSLLLCFMDFLPLHLKLFQNGSNLQDISNIAWMIESLLEAPYGICALLKNHDDDEWTDDCDLFSFKLKERILKLICECCNYSNSEILEKVSSTLTNGISWKNIIYYLSDCLSNLEINNMKKLAYAGQILECLNNLMHSPYHGLDDDTNRSDQQKFIYNLINLSERFSTNFEYHVYKGYSLIFNTLMILSQFIHIFKKKLKEIYSDSDENCSTLVTMCFIWLKSNHFLLKCLSCKALSGLILSDLTVCVEKVCLKTGNNMIKMAVNTLIDLNEASILREQATILLCNILANKNKKTKNGLCDNDELLYLISVDFFDKLSMTITEVCLNDEDIIDSMQENIPLDFLSKKEKYEVAMSKKCLNKIPLVLTSMSTPKCTINLLIQISNVIYNIINVFNEIPENLQKSNLLKILFKCISLKISCHKTKYLLCTSVCRTLYAATVISHEVLNNLVTMKDCMSVLLNLFFEEFTGTGSQKYQKEMLRWNFFLIGSFLETFQGYRSILEIFPRRSIILFFEFLLLTMNNTDFKDLVQSSLYCLVTFINTYTSCNIDSNLNLESVFDDIIVHKKIDDHKSNEINTSPTRIIFNEKLKSSMRESNNSYRKDFNENPHIDVLGEEFCYHLLKLYQDCNIDRLDNRVNAENYDSIATGLCVILGISNKAKIFATNLKFTEYLINNLNEIQYYLMTHAKPQSILRKKKKSPIYHYLNWTILLICNIVSNCPTSKEICVENNLVIPISKLWPWIISDEMTRNHAIQMLSSYTNLYSKSSQTLCMTVGTHSLLTEIIDLLIKEMNLVSQARSLITLEGCLEILKNVSNHVHCRTIIIKSEVFNCLNKLHPAITKRQIQWKSVEAMWESFCLAMSMFPEGQSKIGEYLSTLCAFVHQANGLMLLVLRNCAFNSANRPKYLASAEILQMFSNILSSTQRPMSEKIDVCIAIWALSANNHKSKLSLKMAGVTSKLAECLQYAKSLSNSTGNDFEIQIMTYVLEIMNVK